MARIKLDPSEHVTRYVSHLGQVRDDEGNCLGLLWSAFDLREKIKEEYLSINCVERTHAVLATALSSIRRYLADKNLKSKHAVLTVGNVGAILRTFAHPKVTITSEPTKPDPSYGAVRNLPLERRAALEKLATSTWCDWRYLRDC